LFAFVHLFVLKNLFFFAKHRLILPAKCQIDQIDGLFNGRSEAVLGNCPAWGDSPCSAIDVRMHNSEYKKPVRIVYIVGGSLNWAMKLMGDLAHDGTIPATIKLYDIDHAAAGRNAAIGMRYSAASDGAKVGYHAARAEEIRAADALSDPLVQPIGPNKTTTIFRERVAATRHYLPEELTSGVAA
jgi:hypothetical protein